MGHFANDCPERGGRGGGQGRAYGGGSSGAGSGSARGGRGTWCSLPLCASPSQPDIVA